MRSSVVLWLLVPLCAQAADPTPATAPARDGRWRGLAGASVALTAGNAETTSVLLNLDVARQMAHTKTAVQAYVHYGTSKVEGRRDTTASKWSWSGQYDADVSLRWFAFGKLGFDGDRMADLTLRSTISSGLGYHLINTEQDSADVFGGLSYSDRRYRVPQTVNDHADTHFSGPGALVGEQSTHQLNDRVTFKQRLEFYPDLSDQRAHTGRFNASLNVSMSSALSLSVGLLVNYNRNVPPGIKQTDASLFTGINAKLGQ